MHNLTTIPAEVRYPVFAVRKQIEFAHTIYDIGTECGVFGEDDVRYQVFPIDGYVIFEFGPDVGWVCFRTKEAQEIAKKLSRAAKKARTYKANQIKPYAEGDRWRVGYATGTVVLSFGEQYFAEPPDNAETLASLVRKAVNHAGLIDYEEAENE